jgi:hypothetical protein
MFIIIAEQNPDHSLITTVTVRAETNNKLISGAFLLLRGLSALNLVISVYLS